MVGEARAVIVKAHNAEAVYLHRMLTLAPRRDGRAWKEGDEIGLFLGEGWREVDGTGWPHVTSTVTEVLLEEPTGGHD